MVLIRLRGGGGGGQPSRAQDFANSSIHNNTMPTDQVAEKEQGIQFLVPCISVPSPPCTFPVCTWLWYCHQDNLVDLKLREILTGIKWSPG